MLREARGGSSEDPASEKLAPLPIAQGLIGGALGFDAELEALERLALHLCEVVVRRPSRVRFSEDVETWELPAAEDESEPVDCHSLRGRGLTSLQAVARLGRGVAVVASVAAGWCWEGATVATPPAVADLWCAVAGRGISPLLAAPLCCLESLGALLGPQVGEAPRFGPGTEKTSALLALLAPSPSVMAPSIMAPRRRGTAAGPHRVTYTGTDITVDSEMDSALLGKLAEGADVEVLEVRVLVEQDRVRGRLAAPAAGWISMWNLDGTMWWVAERTPPSEAAPAGTLSTLAPTS